MTTSEPLEAPKQWQNCNVYNIAKLFLDEDGQRDLQTRYERGGEGHGHFKMYLNELVWDYFADARGKFDYYLNHAGEVDEILNEGAKKARAVAAPIMEKIRTATGIYK